MVNGKIYIGKTNNIKVRWSHHQAAARKQNPNDFSYLHRAMLKYGFENFIIEELFSLESELEAFEKEMFFIKQLNSQDHGIGYNLTQGGEGPSGYHHTQDAKLKMKQAKENKYLGVNNPFYNRKHTKASKQLISHAAQQRTGNKNSFYGKRHSVESRLLQKEHHYNKKNIFTKEDIVKIKYDKEVLNKTYKKIAEQYQVHWKTVSNAINNKKSYSSLK